MNNTKVKLDELIEGIKLQNKNIDAFLNSKTGKVVFAENNLYNIVKSDYNLNEYSNKKQRKLKLVKKIMNENYFIALPSKKDISEFSIIKSFIYLIDNEDIKSKLSESIKSNNPYESFNNEIKKIGIKDEWFEFKEKYIKEKLIKWAKYNSFQIVE